MNRAVQAVWWNGLGGAALGTLVILKQVSLVIEALQDIERLAVRTRDAAQGVQANVAVATALPAALAPAVRVAEGAAALAATAATLEQKVDSLGGEPPASGG